MNVLFSEPTMIGPKRYAAGAEATLEESAQLTRAIKRGWASEVKASAPAEAKAEEPDLPKAPTPVASATEEPSAPKRSRKRRKNSSGGSSAS